MKKHEFRKFYFRGIDLDQLLSLSKKDLMDLLNARQRRRLSARGLQVRFFFFVVLFCVLRSSSLSPMFSPRRRL